MNSNSDKRVVRNMYLMGAAVAVLTVSLISLASNIA